MFDSLFWGPILAVLQFPVFGGREFSFPWWVCSYLCGPQDKQQAGTWPPGGGDLAELAAAEQLDIGYHGEPEHLLWRSSPYGSALRRRGTVGWPRGARQVHWAPAVCLERGTQARAVLWRRPRDPG